jgi:hypothetical protein
MPPVRPPPDADAGAFPVLELAWLSASGSMAPLVPPLSPVASPLRHLPEVLWPLVMLLLYPSSSSFVYQDVQLGLAMVSY